MRKMIMTLCVACTFATPVTLAATYYGAPMTVGSGSARVYVIENTSGTVEVGIEADSTAFVNLASDSHLHLDLPTSDSFDVSPIDHIDLGFALNGHPGGPWSDAADVPENSYWAVPHFDVHFMTISDKEADKIIIPNPTDSSDLAYVVPAASDLAAGYALGLNSGISGEGSHWAAGGEFSDFPAPFDYNFLYGFYDGKMTFEEPMVAQTFLADLKNGLTSDVLQAFSVSSTNPAFGDQYFIRYDAGSDVFRMGVTTIPEPSTFLMVGLGLLVFSLCKRY